MAYYKVLDHTADLGIRVWGISLQELFSNAASAMYEQITDIDRIQPSMSKKVKAQGLDRDELLKNWLSELLYYLHTKDIVFCSFKIDNLTDTGINSIAAGGEISRDIHVLKHEIKAITFHNLKIEESNNRLETDIIFDI